MFLILFTELNKMDFSMPLIPVF